jgi:broad specificity phosphatase PhoE
MKNVVVNLYWIRHAYSCANILKQKGIIAKSLKSVVTIDPALTDMGVDQAQKLNMSFRYNILANEPEEVEAPSENNWGKFGKAGREKEAEKTKKQDYANYIYQHGENLKVPIIEKFDVVLSSNLRRAMETAMYAFSGITNPNGELLSIYVVPHISEARNPLASSLNIDKENAPLLASELKKTYDVMKTDDTEFNTNVKFELIQELDPNSKLTPDYEKFIKNVLPKVLDLLPPKEEYNIAIVSHSHFITQHILATDNQKKQIQNTEIWQETLNMSLRTVTVLDKYNNLPTKSCPDKIFCQIYEGNIADPNAIDTRCKKIQDSSAYSFAFGKDKPSGTSIQAKPTASRSRFGKSKGGSDHDKYVKYKLKYLELKNEPDI